MPLPCLPEIKTELEQIAESLDRMATSKTPLSYEKLTGLAELLDDNARDIRKIRDAIVFEK